MGGKPSSEYITGTDPQYLLTLSNWFMFYTMTRTYSNSLETVLTVCTLYYWPDPQRPAVCEQFLLLGYNSL